LRNERRLRAFAFLINGQWRPDYEYPLDGTPCAAVIDGGELVHFPDRIVELFPEDHGLAKIGAVSYLAMPLFDAYGRVMGHLGAAVTNELPPRAGGDDAASSGRWASRLLVSRASCTRSHRATRVSYCTSTSLDDVSPCNARGSQCNCGLTGQADGLATAVSL